MAADIDIDVADREQVLAIIPHVRARLETDTGVRHHNSGIYGMSIPYDPIHDCASIEYQKADDLGYIKIDLLNMGVYGLVRDPEHYQQMLLRDPPWSRLWQDPEWASQVVHVGNYTDLLASMRPDSIPRMAAFLSIIRPGKAHLQNCAWDQVFATVWDRDESRGYTFKKSHAIGYAALVALHMNLLEDHEISLSGAPE